MIQNFSWEIVFFVRASTRLRTLNALNFLVKISVLNFFIKLSMWWCRGNAVFNYTVGGHDVVRYSRKTEFDNCARVTLQRWTSGADRIVLNSTGFFYCICSIPGHCETGGGMKLSIHVTTTRAVAPTPPHNGTLVAPSASPTTPARSAANPSPNQSISGLVAAAILPGAAFVV
uniref:Phytocyanin domain-containing protein n=1 Tax=Physcomitrium patens TaxID=3218 RepID=A0A7I3YZL1_PHYPA